MDIFNLQDDQESIPDPKPVEETKALAQVSTNNLLAATSLKAGISVTTDQLAILDDFMLGIRNGHQASLPMMCKGSSCRFLKLCPLYKAKMALPVGKSCPVESALIAEWVKNTLSALHIDPSDPDNAIDVNMVFELAGLELLRYRAAYHLSEDPELVSERVVGYSPQGDAITAEVPKASLIILEKYNKIVSKLRDQLLATRRSQAQVGKVQNDISSRAASMLAKATELAEKRKSARNKPAPVDAEFDILNGPTNQAGDKPS